MGLDIVELILAIEDRFQIHIPDEEAGEIRTVSDLHRVVSGKLRSSTAPHCVTSHAFYQVRRAMVEVLSLERRSIRPDTPLAAVLPAGSRRGNWKRIQACIGYRLPALQQPVWVRWGFPLAGASLLLLPGFTRPHLLVPGLLAGLLAAYFVWAMGGSDLPRHLVSVGDLTRDLASRAGAGFAGEIRAAGEAEVWEALCDVIVQQTGVKRESITPEAAIVDDLGID